jgi:hypothetical protein
MKRFTNKILKKGEVDKLKKLILVLVLGLVLGLVTSAQAATTPIYDTTWNYGAYHEWDLVSGLPTLPGAPNPGGSVQGANDILDYYYSSWTRIDDSNDQLWFDLDGGALVIKAIYTSAYHKLGYSTDENTGSPITWFSGNSGGNLDTVGETSNFDNLDNSDAFVWVIGGAGTGNKYSRQALNGGTDSMVSFRINGILNTPGNPGGGYTAPINPTYLIGFEDWTDKDFQDFVLQVSKVAPVPEPASMLLLGMGILGMFGLKRKSA